MRILTQAVGNSTIALLAVVVILAGSFAYYYSATANQSTVLSAKANSLNAAGMTLCRAINATIPTYAKTYFNVTLTLREQIQSDKSTIAMLNSTRPSGYTNITAELNSQITHDQYIIDAIRGPDTTGTIFGIASATNPCSAFGVNFP